MKVGDLVTVHPACLNRYIIIERLSYEGTQSSLWLLHDGGNPCAMSQRFMEVISECR